MQLDITDSQYCYGIYELTDETLTELHPNCIYQTGKKRRKKWKLDGVFVHYLMKELNLCGFYRYSFVEYNSYRRYDRFYDWFVITLQPTKCDLIDYDWNNRVYTMVREMLELNHMLSWLSTLGGAFSALGDYSVNFALTAGKISIHQLKLALRLGDPSIQARCRLYFALSLIQRKCFHLAKRIILKEYEQAKSVALIDTRLVNMCKGIWAKLQYEHAVWRQKKGLNSISHM